MAEVQRFDVDLSTPGQGARIRVNDPATEQLLDEKTWAADRERYQVIEIILVRTNATTIETYRVAIKKNRYD